MDQAETQKVVRNYLQHLVDRDIVDRKAYAVVFGSHALGDAREHECIEVLIISDRFGKDLINERFVLEKATWFTDTRLFPTPTTPDDWASPENSAKLSRSKTTGQEIRL